MGIEPTSEAWGPALVRAAFAIWTVKRSEISPCPAWPLSGSDSGQQIGRPTCASPSHRYALLRTRRGPRDSITIAKAETVPVLLQYGFGVEFNLQLTLRRQLWPRLRASV
jgi:hypothetical protein